MSDQLLTVLKFALLAVLYLFFLRVVRAVWAELKEPKVAQVPAVAAGAAPTVAQPVPGSTSARHRAAPANGQRLVVIDPPESQGRTFPLSGELGWELTVGRAAGCGIALTEDTFVSQLHARVFRSDGGWQIEDLGSTNGTFLNRHKVSAPEPLHQGDRVQVGKTVLEVTA